MIKKIALFAVGNSSWHGGIQYILNFIAGLDVLAQKQNATIHVLVFKNKHQKFESLEEFTFLNIDFVDVNNGIPQVGILNKIYNFARFKLFNLNYSPRIIDFIKSQKVEFVYPVSLPSSVGLNSAGWVADFQHRNFPNVISTEFTKKAEIWISDELKRSSKVVLSSEFCRKDCEQFFPDYVKKTIVMPFAVYLRKALFTDELLNQTVLKYNLQRPFLVISNLFAVTKNHKVVFEALKRLKNSGLVIQLYCTGNIVDERDIGFANEILKYISLNGISGQVHLLGLIPREDQISIYRLSTAMIQPSLSEGWSTCVEEAKHLGKEMLLSDLEVHREQWPSNLWFFNGNDPKDLSIKIEELFNLNRYKKFPELEREKLARTEYKANFVSFAESIQNVVDFELKQ